MVVSHSATTSHAVMVRVAGLRSGGLSGGLGDVAGFLGLAVIGVSIRGICRDGAVAKHQITGKRSAWVCFGIAGGNFKRTWRG